MELDLENPLPMNTIQSLFNVETDQNLSEKMEINSHLRSEIVSLISKFSSKFDHTVSYLAINYLDRFLFTHTLPMGNPWAVRLMATSCVSLALKMFLKTESSVSDIDQHDGGLIFATETICRMEILILGALKWRMRSITPFAFINFFIASFKFKDPPLVQALKARATEVIFKAQNDLKTLELKPSLISASALLCASHELFPLQYPCFKEAISTCEYVNKDKLYICYKMIQEIAKDGYESVLELSAMSSSNTPLNVLDFHNHSTTTTTSSVISSDNKENSEEEAIKAVDSVKLERETKRLKVRKASEAPAAKLG